MKRPAKRSRSGFTLIEVLAAFVIAVVLLVPIAATISGVAGSMRGLDRSAVRRTEFRSAMAAAASITPLQAGRFSVDDYVVEVAPYRFERERDLQGNGWALYSVTVAAPDGMVIETVRMGRL